ncbi:MAG TPA: low temperature requirement protein A [Luteibacter sp.]|uniref:low temperature requirement protein A n=1 Tax=Luteibacter sp. TaxID=1886636 RepID=UPI002B666992|nr:low temperature requirement protein A [Luteibacter sp.]HVI56452.1 low temperature requirement protein A [Luteibacter sp.]
MTAPEAGGYWPLPRRHPDDKSDPVELLVDITFVLALSQAGSLMRTEPGATGVYHALATLAIVVVLWQISVNAVTYADVRSPMMKLLLVAQTGTFLALAICLPEAFTSRPGGLNGPVLFAAVVTVTVLIETLKWVYACASPRHIGNVGAFIAGYWMLAALVWRSVWAEGSAKTSMVFLGYLAMMAMVYSTVMPTYRWLRVGIVEGWHCGGVRAYAERSAAGYTVACCLSLELLEQVGQAAAITPAMLTLVLAALMIAYVMYRLYKPLVEPARWANDAKNSTLGLGRKLILNFGYTAGHMLMFGGLVVSAGALRLVFIDLTASETGSFDSSIATPALIELYVGIAGCLFGQALFSFTAIWRPDLLRLGGVALLVGGLPLLIGKPVFVPVLTLLCLCTGVLYLERLKVTRAHVAVRTAEARALAGAPTATVQAAGVP